MSDMVEKVARAIHMCAMQQEPDLAPWEKLGSPFKNDYLFQARAAFAAIREPTEEMMESGWQQMPELLEAWRAMIDAALVGNLRA